MSIEVRLARECAVNCDGTAQQCRFVDMILELEAEQPPTLTEDTFALGAVCRIVADGIRTEYSMQGEE